MSAQRLTRLAVAALLLGLVLRVAGAFTMDVWEDGGEYAAMGHAWAQRGDLLLPSGEDRAPPGLATGEPGHSHHFAPAWPVALGLVYRALGFGLWQTQLASALVALASVGVVWACTRDLYGPRPAVWVAALVALDPQLLWSTGRGYAESLAVLFFTLTLWAIVRSLDQPRFILLGGLFAGLAYLTRSSMGPFFVVAGMGGLLWRLRHRGWRGVAQPHYLAAAGIFAGIVLAWSARNVAHFGSWQTSAYVAFVTRHAFAHPDRLALGLAGKLVLFAGGLAFYMLPLSRPLRERARSWRTEEGSALVLAVALVVLLAWLLTAILWAYEGVYMFFAEHLRYSVIALVPLAWLALREPLDAPSTRRAWGALALVLALLSAAVIAAPFRDPEARAAEWLRGVVEPGDRIAVEGLSLYGPYPYLGDLDVRLVRADAPAEFRLSVVDAEPAAGEELVGSFVQPALLRAERSAWVFARADVALERDLTAATSSR